MAGSRGVQSILLHISLAALVLLGFSDENQDMARDPRCVRIAVGEGEMSS